MPPTSPTSRPHWPRTAGRGGPLMVGAIFAIVACTAAETTPTRVVTRDSAGVRIDEVTDTAGVAAFALSTAPVYAHGARPDDYAFTQPMLGVLDADGRVYVYDAGSGEVIHLSPDGRLQPMLAMRGAGPDEVGSVAALVMLPGDTLLVEDDGNARVARFVGGRRVGLSRQGGDAMQSLWLSVLGGTPDGRLLMSSAAFVPGFAEPWLQGHLVVASLNGAAIDTVGTYDWIGRTDPRAPAYPFPNGGAVAAARGMFVVGRTDVPELRWIDPDGTLRRMLRWPAASSPATEADFRAFLDRIADEAPRVNPGIGGEALDALIARQQARYALDPDRLLPRWFGMTADGDGRLWLPSFAPGGADAGVARYVVIGADGTWLGPVEMPARFRLLDARGDRVLGVALGDDDVPLVTVYVLEARP